MTANFSKPSSSNCTTFSKKNSLGFVNLKSTHRKKITQLLPIIFNFEFSLVLEIKQHRDLFRHGRFSGRPFWATESCLRSTVQWPTKILEHQGLPTSFEDHQQDSSFGRIQKQLQIVSESYEGSFEISWKKVPEPIKSSIKPRKARIVQFELISWFEKQIWFDLKPH